MDVTLKEFGGGVDLYFDDKLVTEFKNKSIDQVTEWISKNLTNIRVHTEI